MGTTFHRALTIRSPGILVAVAFAAASFFGAARADTFLRLASTPGDSPALNRTLHDTDGTFTAEKNADGNIRVKFLVSTVTFWDLRFGAASGPLVPGTYELAERFGFQSPGHPGLSMNGADRACETLYGRFVVHELTFAVDGSVQRFAADFEQHCDFFGTADYGAVRFNSSVPYAEVPPPAAPGMIRIERAPTPALPALHISLDNTNYEMSGRTFSQGVQISHISNNALYQVLLATDTSYVPLQPGVYESAQKSPTPGHPMLSFLAPSNGCGVTNGRFVVHEIETSPHGYVIKFAADFALYCDDQAMPMYGGVRFNSTYPYAQIAPPAAPGPAAIRLEYLDSVRTFRVPVGTSLGTIRFATTDSAGNRMGDQPVIAVAYCGLFTNGTDNVSVRSDSSGIVQLPTWNAPNSVTTCQIVATLSGPLGGAQISFSVEAVLPTPPTPVTTASGTSPAGGTITLSLATSVASCTLGRASFIDPGTISPPVAPLPDVANLSMPHGYLDFRADNCGSGLPVVFNVDFAQDLPPTAQWWKYGPTADNRTPHWYVIASTVSGKRISFTIVDGGLGDDDLTMNGSISDLGMVAIPGGTMQDLWWSGSAENGWGMSIVQHRDVLFANIFAYDAQGVATWYVMPSGSWNTDHTIYTGNLYLPKGSAYYAYDASRFDIGASIGTMRLTFANANQASFDYTINGVSGHKSITRIAFGPADAPTDKPLADLWWAGSAQNGWGIALLQQYSTLFALWFTYDANGKATWFVMPGGSWTAKDDYRGSIYKAVGPPWLGVPYDVSRHHTIESGTFRLRFSGDSATFDYTAEGRSGSIPLSRIPF